MGSLFLLPGPDAHTTLCEPSKSRVSVSPILLEVLQSNPTSLQSLILWEFLLPVPDPHVGKPDVGFRTFNPVGRLLWYNCSPVYKSPTQRLWDLILLWLHPSYHLIAASPLSLVVGYLFWWVPVSSCRRLFSSYDSSALARGSECMSLYSAILNQSPRCLVLKAGSLRSRC